jgi:biotin carboxylase
VADAAPELYDLSWIGGLDACAFHAEIMWTEQGYRMIEVNGRIGGDLIHTHLVPPGSGIDLIEAAYRAVLGDTVGLANSSRSVSGAPRSSQPGPQRRGACPPAWRGALR